VLKFGLLLLNSINVSSVIINFEKELWWLVWFEIDLDSLRSNFHDSRRLVDNYFKIISPSKRKAYDFDNLELTEVVISIGL